MNQPHTSDTIKTDPTDDHGNAPDHDGGEQFAADRERSAAVARLRERFSFGD